MKNFELGQLVATRAVADKMQEDSKFASFVQLSLNKYLNCDWGNMDAEDKALNDAAVKSGEERIHAAYIMKSSGLKIWIITEWDRSATTILFPSDY